jgi:BirA family biotin operon repressor/biotin-[acetyl-CoA-carboxylase] ligase
VTPSGQPDLPAAWRERDISDWQAEIGVPRLEISMVLPSTNDRARDLAATGAAPMTTVIAGTQSSGRGRSGRSWHSPPDSGLWISVILAGEMGAAGVLPLAVGVGVARALERFSPRRVDLKWPNDLLVDDRKVAGILCEATGDSRHGIVVGIGVNLRRPPEGVPEELEESIIFLEEVSAGMVPEPALTRALIGELGRWAQPAPPSLEGRLRTEWEERDCLRGRAVRTESGPVGTATGISSDGALEIRSSTGETVRIRSGGVRLETGATSTALHAFSPDRTIQGAE